MSKDLSSEISTIKRLESPLKRSIGTVSSFLTSLLSVACPACFPAVGGFLSSLGLGFLAPLGYNLWLIGTLIGLAILSFWYTYTKHKKIWVPLLGTLGALGLIVSRIIWVSTPLAALSIAGLLSAGVANILVKRKAACCST